MKEKKKLVSKLVYALDKIGNKATGDIYHYCPAEKFLEIIRDKIILKFTRYDCLNDYTEGLEINTIFQRVCEKLLKNTKISKQFYNCIYELKAIDKTKVPVKKELIPYIGYPSYETEADLYLCCFSSDGDSLPMWNYYLKNDKYQGYALRFYIDDMQKIDSDKEISFKHVIYNRKEKDDKIEKILLTIYSDKSLNYEEKKGEIVKYLSEYRLLFKNPAFINEKEIRAILKVPRNTTENIEYEIKNGMIKPFVKIEFKKEAFRGIILSPSLNNEISIKTMKEYLNKLDYSNIDVDSSTIPIRY